MITSGSWGVLYLLGKIFLVAREYIGETPTREELSVGYDHSQRLWCINDNQREREKYEVQ